MAVILEFRATSDERDARPRRRRRRSAEIVIFPGVRYERWRDGETRNEVAKAATPRDVLKLVE